MLQAVQARERKSFLKILQRAPEMLREDIAGPRLRCMQSRLIQYTGSRFQGSRSVRFQAAPRHISPMPAPHMNPSLEALSHHWAVAVFVAVILLVCVLMDEDDDEDDEDDEDDDDDDFDEEETEEIPPSLDLV